MEFQVLKLAVKNQFDKMSKNKLFVTDIDKDTLWETYLKSFPEGTNPIFKERTKHDCQCCKSFIKNAGNVVTIIENKLVSIWDVEIDNYYQVVANELSKAVKSSVIKDVFFHFDKNIGTNFNHQLLESGETQKWEHFHYKLPNKFVKKECGSILSEKRANKEVFKRSLDEISTYAIEIVDELISQKSIYRGEEHKDIISKLLDFKNEFDSLPENEKDNYCWIVSENIGPAAKIKNTVIGTLLSDISNGTSLDEAVKMFESKVAPANYKRPKAIVTKKMIENAQKKVEELEIDDSLYRRYANVDDITINNILFANRSTKKMMNVFDELKNDISIDIKKLKIIDEVFIETFMKDILPKSKTVEFMFEKRHKNNLMSLIAPVNKDSKNILKWNNNFTWAYNGEVADSMKQRVKSAGGKVDGVLRFSIMWNDGDNNQNDFDAHCSEPNGNLIDYRKKGFVQNSSGILDVDIQYPGNKVAVENITWSDIDRMQEGEYVFLVHNFSHNGGKTGFTAEIEYNGEIWEYEYNKELKHNEKVVVAVIDFCKTNGIKFIKSLNSVQQSKDIWNVSTNKFHNVSMIMNSPNHWDGNKTGNKHYFFILENCLNPENARGFFNEFLNEDLREHRKVFEALGSKMKVEKSNNQLSGLGFSSTQKNSCLCKVTGSFNRTIKIIF